MIEPRRAYTEKYIITLRVIQPARIQDILKAYSEIWGIELDDRIIEIMHRIHSDMRANAKLVSVRRGTYVLSSDGMKIAAELVRKERKLDNARLFLMKNQRKEYRKFARRFG